MGLEEVIGNTPLLRLTRIAGAADSEVWVKLEGNNPAGSIKDRTALAMINRAEQRGEIREGARLIEATSGNTGIALAMICAVKGYPLCLIMPENMSHERQAAMRAYGAELVLVNQSEGMEGARNLAMQMEQNGEGKVLDQFNNPDNAYAHYSTTGPEIWRQSGGRVTHFVSCMGTTGTITGVSQYLKQRNPSIEVTGLQPQDGSLIPGIRRWEAAYMPAIYQQAQVDRLIDVRQQEAEEMARQLARVEGIFCGTSSGGAVHQALRIAAENRGAVIVTIICDRGDRYLSTGLFDL